MSEHKKEEGCCGTQGSQGPCCSGKKMLIFIVAGAVIFLAGMLFAKYCPLSGKSGMMCPIPSAAGK